MYCGKLEGKDRSKNGVDGVDDEAMQETEPEDFGDMVRCAVGAVADTAIGQPNARIQDDLPPGLIDPVSFDPWQVSTYLSSGRDLWQDQLTKYVPIMHHKHPPAPPSRALSACVMVSTSPQVSDGQSVAPPSMVRQVHALSARYHETARYRDDGLCGTARGNWKTAMMGDAM